MEAYFWQCVFFGSFFCRHKKMNKKMLQKIIELQEIIFYFCSEEIRKRYFNTKKKGAELCSIANNRSQWRSVNTRTLHVTIN